MVGEWGDMHNPCKRFSPTKSSRGQQCEFGKAVDGHTATECCTQGSKTDARTVLEERNAASEAANRN